MTKKIIPVGKRGVLYMPKEILKEFHVNEGDYMEVYGTKDGIVLKPKTLVDKAQAWFMTEAWQKGEKEAEDDLKNGRFTTYESAEDFAKAMEKRRKAKKK